MYKLLHKLPARIIIAIIVGLLLASFFTKISYGCIPEATSDCGGSKFAVLHLNDLLESPSERGNFIETFLASGLVSFVILSIAARFKQGSS